MSDLIPPHGGVDGTYSETVNGTEAQQNFQYQYVDVTYDEAWPWDAITDPAIRRRVYDLYTPFNAE